MHPRNASSTLPNQSRSAKPAGIVPLSPSLAHFRTPTATRSNLHSARQPSYPTSRAFLHWRLSDDGPVRAAPPSWGRHQKPFTKAELECLFDQLVGKRQQTRWNLEANRLSLR